MAKAQLHGLRNGKLNIPNGHGGTSTLRVDTKTDPDWVVIGFIGTNGRPVARAAKTDNGRFYRQGTNPDREGFLGYTVQRWDDKRKEWKAYTTTASAGQITHWLWRFV